jgi:hypothetical protein
VILNLITNAFNVVDEKKKAAIIIQIKDKHLFELHLFCTSNMAILEPNPTTAYFI